MRRPSPRLPAEPVLIESNTASFDRLLGRLWRVSPDLDPTPRVLDPVADLVSVLDLEPAGSATLTTQFDDTQAEVDLGQNVADVFIGRSQPQPHGRIFGGQVLAQCIMAAGRTVDEAALGAPRPIHSLHGYFLRAGDSSKPVRFAVERLRDGGSFSARRVHAVQNGAPIMSVIMSFQERADGIDHQVAMPDVAPPESLPTTADVVGDLDHPVAQHWAHGRAVDVRHVEGALYVEPASERKAHQSLWMRLLGEVTPDPLMSAAILAYASDYTMLESAMRANGLAWSTPGYRAASLDHAMWFHRPIRLDDWILYTQESPSASGGRGLGVGRMFTRDGILVATVAQEGMMRVKTPATP